MARRRSPPEDPRDRAFTRVQPLASSPAREEKFTKVGSFRDLREKRKREDAGVGPVITVVAGGAVVAFGAGDGSFQPGADLFQIAAPPKKSANFCQLFGIWRRGGRRRRSTATTVLSLSAIRSLKNEPTLNDRARKLLSFTDNRQAVDGAPGTFPQVILTRIDPAVGGGAKVLQRQYSCRARAGEFGKRPPSEECRSEECRADCRIALQCRMVEPFDFSPAIGPHRLDEL